MRIYNNYDGYMYTIKELSLGSFEFKGVYYNLDDNVVVKDFLDNFVKDGLLFEVLSYNGIYTEIQYRFNECHLPDEVLERHLHKTQLQWKATILNIKMMINILEWDFKENRNRI